MTKQKKRNIIIGALCSVLLLMAVGYAAFNTLLNVEGTTSITSNWDIKITGITSKDIVGEASTVEGYPTYNDLTAEFQTNLVSPGDSIEYDVTVTNQGNLDAELARIKVSENDNPAIKFTTSGLEEGDILTAGDSDVLTVKVEYSDEVTKQPDNLTASLTATLDYVEKGKKSEWTPSDDTETAAETLIKTATTSGEGLYIDTYEDGRYVYKGKNPNNYITFNGETAGWRIVAVENDGAIKIMRNSSLGSRVFDTQNRRQSGYCRYQESYGCNAWAAISYFDNNYGLTAGIEGAVTENSELKDYLNSTYYNLIKDNKNDIQKHKWYFGAVTYLNNDLQTQIKNEKKYSIEDNVGLIGASDYIKASLDSNCNTYKNLNSNYSSCKNTNYLYKNDNYWTISPSYEARYTRDSCAEVVVVWNDGNLSYTPDAEDSYQVYPVIYLKPDIQLEGTGKSGEPYTITIYPS